MRYEREDENARIHNVHPVFHPLELKSVSRTMKKQGCAMCILVPTSEFFPPSLFFCPAFDSAILSSSTRCNTWRIHLWQQTAHINTKVVVNCMLFCRSPEKLTLICSRYYGPALALQATGHSDTLERVQICACMSCGFLIRIRNSSNDIPETLGVALQLFHLTVSFMRSDSRGE